MTDLSIVNLAIYGDTPRECLAHGGSLSRHVGRPTREQLVDGTAYRNGAFRLGRVVAINGTHHAKLWCNGCNRDLTGSIKHDTLPIPIHNLPVERDNRISQGCEVCGAIGALERHHLAPRHLFHDADEWPVVDICPKCHHRWHRLTRTGPYAPRRTDLERFCELF